MMQEKDINRLPELTLSDEEQTLLTGKLYEELKRQEHLLIMLVKKLLVHFLLLENLQ